MRTASVVITLAVACMTGQLQAEPPKSLPRELGSGRIAWFDITTASLQQSSLRPAGRHGSHNQVTPAAVLGEGALARWTSVDLRSA